ncbi:hypothetical protein [Cupriavidus consociatus]|uniref:hypothetical protein n=1 Tax=Cupriavidus consociatus TaxID=2821357 RepID=UPI001AEB9863|nr:MULTISPECIES: hypothetical protein [unclassified Cupriavidus]MBP0618750.1 hypothetical protein [Cupriavidus sp. LEh25]MDK2655391.1 hypothetical protein [Cupriavidus sp. LEh21]
MKVLLRAVLFFDALVDLLLGVLLLMSPFTTLYAALQLPQPQPALFGQLLGVALVGLSVLLWQAAFNGQLTVPVARTAGYVNLASAMLIIAWMVFLELPLEGAGKIWLPTMAVVLLFFAAVQIPAAKRVRVRERQLKMERALKEQETKEPGVAPAARQTNTPEYRREPVITPPPGYGPGTEVVTEPATEDTPSAHHARQNPHS